MRGRAENPAAPWRWRARSGRGPRFPSPRRRARPGGCGCSSGGAEVVVPDELVPLELRDAAPFEHDLAVHDDVAPVGDADRLVEVLLSHQDREAVLRLELLDLGDGVRDEDRGE